MYMYVCWVGLSGIKKMKAKVHHPLGGSWCVQGPHVGQTRKRLVAWHSNPIGCIYPINVVSNGVPVNRRRRGHTLSNTQHAFEHWFWVGNVGYSYSSLLEPRGARKSWQDQDERPDVRAMGLTVSSCGQRANRSKPSKKCSPVTFGSNPMNRQTRHPRNVEFNKVLEACFSEAGSSRFSEAWNL
jgi:hypothetical protein